MAGKGTVWVKATIDNQGAFCLCVEGGGGGK